MNRPRFLLATKTTDDHVIFSINRLKLSLSGSTCSSAEKSWKGDWYVVVKEVIKEQPSSRNLSATTARVLQCTCPVAASRKDRSAIVKLYC